MKLKIIDTNKTEKGSKELPAQFSEPVREDLIQRAVLTVQFSNLQPYGASHLAGKRHSTKLSRRRSDYKGSYGKGISRVPRKIMSKSGERMNWMGAEMPGTVGGRQAHPPKAERDWTQKINEKENRKAIRSAISATVIPKLVQERGHIMPKEFPFMLDSKVEDIAKTSQVHAMLEKLGFESELSRTSNVSMRSGKGKNRGRMYRNKKGPLFVVSKECSLIKSARNIPGVDVVAVKNINAELLAPGCKAGRLTLWSEAAVDLLAREKLFAEDYKGKSEVKEKKEIKKEAPKQAEKAKPKQKAAKETPKKTQAAAKAKPVKA